MNKRPSASSILADLVLSALASAGPAGLAVTEFCKLHSQYASKIVSRKMWELRLAGKAFRIKAWNDSRYYASQKQADQNMAVAVADIERCREARREEEVQGKTLAFLATVPYATRSDVSEHVGNSKAAATAVLVRLRHAGLAWKYGPLTRVRYANKPFTDDMKANVDADILDDKKRSKREQYVSKIEYNREYQRTHPRPRREKPTRRRLADAIVKASKALAAKEEAALQKKLKLNQCMPAKAKKPVKDANGFSRDAKVVTPDNVKVVRVVTPADRWSAGADYVGEFSKEWQDKRSSTAAKTDTYAESE